ncbi:restriction endonuclease subunit S [Bacteroides fragilis]|uniref:restriction endonuclease subunit S n=3 Tax=Bacteroides TaxID=816 RepID=UPI001305255E|nr:restriction endonuclease subunit S [Bacteroides fragilis]MCE8557668.1 restriction endonuclease subunit S [Bacteroides fragilis]
MRFPEFCGEWECTSIGNIGEIKNGPFGSVLHAEDYVEEGIPIVTTEHFKTGLMPSDKFGIPQVSNEDYIRLKGYRLETNDIVFSRVGSVDINAHVGIEQNGWLFSGRVLRVRPKHDVDSLFLHYALSTEAVKRDIRNRAVGQTMPSINTPILSSTTIRLPKELSEQKKVAHFLRLLDERIATQNKIIEKLQSLIKGLNDSLYKQYGNAITTSFSDFGRSYSGLSGKSADDFGSGKPFITYLNVYSNNVVKENDYQYVRINDGENQNVVKYGDVLFTLSSETPEEVGVGSVYLGKNEIYLNSFCFGIHIENKRIAYSPYLSYYVASTPFRKFIYPFAQGSTRFNLCKADFEKASIKLPLLENQKYIYAILNSITEKIEIEKSLLRHYTTQKQYLLCQMFI